MAVVTVRPMARGPEPLMSVRLASHTPKTTRTKEKVEKNSTPKACVGFKSSGTEVTPIVW